MTLSARMVLAALLALGTVSTPALVAAQQAPAAGQTPPRPAQPAQQAPARPAQPAQPAQPTPQQQQQRQAAEQPPRPVTGTTTGWVKICQPIPETTPPRQGCLITQEVRAENGAFLGGATIQEVQGDPTRSLQLALPLGLALQAGFLVRVDQGVATPGKFGTCFPNACFGALELGTDMLNAMRRGQNVLVTVRNAQGVALDLVMPLATFVRAYDGAPTDLQVVEEQQRRLEEELARRAEQTRQQLMQQQGGQPGAAPAVPAAPAAPAVPAPAR